MAKFWLLILGMRLCVCYSRSRFHSRSLPPKTPTSSFSHVLGAARPKAVRYLPHVLFWLWKLGTLKVCALAAGASPYALDHQGVSPLHVAAATAQVNMFDLLLAGQTWTCPAATASTTASATAAAAVREGTGAVGSEGAAQTQSAATATAVAVAASGGKHCGCSSLLLAAVKGGSLEILRSLLSAGEVAAKQQVPNQV